MDLIDVNKTIMKPRILITCALICAAIPSGFGSRCVFANPPAEQGTSLPSTLFGGNFDDYLMLAIDRNTHTIDGYYNDGKCQFAFRDSLSPTTLYQRSDFGEAYIVDSWNPVRPAKHFTTTIYSRAKDGYQAQLTLEPGQGNAARPSRCRARITLDRSDHADFVGVRVVRRLHAPLFRIGHGGKLKLAMHLAHLDRVPPPGTGVWAARTYSAAYSPKGYVYTNWYAPSGTPRGGYIRSRDLYPLPTAAMSPRP